MKQKNLSKIKNNGFSLIELLVVIAIVGLLAGIIAIALANARVKGRDAKRVGDIRQLITAMDQYYIVHGSYPTGSASVGGTGTYLDDPAALDGSLEPFVPNYVPIIPTAPKPADNCAGDPGRGNNNYWYDVASNASTYTITFCLGKDSGNWLAGTRSATPNGVQ